MPSALFDSRSSSDWTNKKLHNTAFFKSGAVLGALALAGYPARSSLVNVSAQILATVHLLSFGTWFGTVVYTTFVLGITMFKNLPRRTFGNLQAKLFPNFFNLCAVSILLQLITVNHLPSISSQKDTIALCSAFVATLLNLFYLEPLTSKNMQERYSLEDMPGGSASEKYKNLKATFGKLHGFSSLINLIALCGAVVHGFYLASALVA